MFPHQTSPINQSTLSMTEGVPDLPMPPAGIHRPRVREATFCFLSGTRSAPISETESGDGVKIYYLGMDRAMTLLMSQHSRCGKDSPMNVLSQWMLKEIIDQIFGRVAWHRVEDAENIDHTEHLSGLAITFFGIPNVESGTIYYQPYGQGGFPAPHGVFRIINAAGAEAVVIVRRLDLLMNMGALVISCGSCFIGTEIGICLGFNSYGEFPGYLDTITQVINGRTCYYKLSRDDTVLPMVDNLIGELMSLFKIPAFIQDLAALKRTMAK